MAESSRGGASSAVGAVADNVVGGEAQKSPVNGNITEFTCIGIYSDVTESQDSGDSSGLELEIESANLINVTVYEGSKETVPAKDIVITGNRIKFTYFGNIFNGLCTKKGITYSGFDNNTGKQSNSLILKFRRKTVERQIEEASAKEQRIAREVELNKMVNEAKDNGFDTVELYREFLEKQKRLSHSGIELKQ